MGAAYPDLYAAVGQVIEHVAFLMADAALDRGVDAEDVVDGLAQRLAAVENDEHALVDIEATAGEVRQQRGRDGGVLGGPVPQPQGELDAVGVDAEADDALQHRRGAFENGGQVLAEAVVEQVRVSGCRALEPRLPGRGTALQ